MKILMSYMTKNMYDNYDLSVTIYKSMIYLIM